MAERTGVADEEILRDLEALGYTPETVVLLHLVPPGTASPSRWA